MYKIIELKNDKDKVIMNKIVSYEDKIFGEGSIGKWNISPFSKYGKIFVLMDRDEIISVVEILNSFQENTAYIYGFFTVEKYMNKGFGSKLLDYTLNYLKTIGKERVELTVQINNIHAINLYEKYNFKKEKILLDEYGDGNKRFLMVKTFDK